MGPVNGWEFILLIVIAIVVLGPDRLPDYAAKLARFVVQARRMANDAKGQLKDQMGPEFDEVNWRQYDPRQYDPRRIVREALLEPIDDAFTIPDDVGRSGAGSTAVGVARDGEVLVSDDEPELLGTPYDIDAT